MACERLCALITRPIANNPKCLEERWLWTHLLTEDKCLRSKQEQSDYLSRMVEAARIYMLMAVNMDGSDIVVFVLYLRGGR